MTANRRVVLAFYVYSPGAHRGIMEYSRPRRWFLECYGLPNTEISVRRHPDGMITTLGPDPRLRQLVEQGGCPVVDLTRNEPDLGVDRVVVDDGKTGESAAGYFVHRRYRRYLFFARRNDPAAREQFAGFRRVAADSVPGAEINAFYLDSQENGPGAEPSVAARIREIVGSLSPRLGALGAFCNDDMLGAQVVEACLAAGIAVPSDVAVLGCGDDDLVCDSLPVTLSSIDTGHQRLGRLAARRLDALMGGAAWERRTLSVPPLGIVDRVSTNHFAVSRPDVAEALRYIVRSFRDPEMDVLHVAGHVQVSKTSLTRAFREELGHGIAEEIRHTRLEHAKLLLRRGMGVGKACRQSGFANDASFRKAFRRSTGLAPSEYAAMP